MKALPLGCREKVVQQLPRDWELAMNLQKQEIKSLVKLCPWTSMQDSHIVRLVLTQVVALTHIVCGKLKAFCTSNHAQCSLLHFLLLH